MIRKTRRLQVILLVMVLLALAYLRNSYYLHFPGTEGSVLSRMTRNGSIVLDNEGIVLASEKIRFLSATYYWFLFLILHSAILWMVFQNRVIVRTHLICYFGLSLISVLLLMLYKQFSSFSGLYYYASIIKNFLLSPLYTAVAYIFVKYFAKIVT